MKTRLVILMFALIGGNPIAWSAEPLDLGNRRELFADTYLIDSLQGAQLELGRPRDEGIVVSFDKPWEGRFCGYSTLIRDGDDFKLYYRGRPEAGKDGDEGEVTCYAESKDGIHWTKPNLGLFELHGTKENNVLLADAAPVTHNFSPLLDPRPDVPADERYKALGGTVHSGLIAWASHDGIHWRRLRDEPVIARKMVPYRHMFDSQNVAFWSPSEQKYLCYFRVFEGGIRRICRSSSDDFINWSAPVLMEYLHAGGSPPLEHLYTNQTHPYFRAPHLYVAIAARFMPGRQVLTDAQAQAIKVDPKYFRDTSDAVLMTTRGGSRYERALMGGFIRGGIGAQNWVSRTNYPTLNVVQTGPEEMSIYVNQDYAQPTAHLRRYSLRLDGFASLRASYQGGEMITKPIRFNGNLLRINFATSAAGGIRVEIQTAAGKPIPGFTLAKAREQIGNEIARTVAWKKGSDLSELAGQPIRLRIVMKDADLYSMRFGDR